MEASERFDVAVVGSGAGGGVIAGELAARGRSVLLLEAGGHHSAEEFVRWETRAARDLWWPLRFAFPAGDPGLGPVVLIGGRCVGGSTTINTKVALRASQRELDKWYAATGLVNEQNEPISRADLDPYYERVERYLGVRERTDWDLKRCVQTAKRGFDAIGARLEPVSMYTDENCAQCGSCLQGCPTNAGKSTLNTYIHHNLPGGALKLRPDSMVQRIVIEDRGAGPEATGVDRRDRRSPPRGRRRGRGGMRIAVDAAAAAALPSAQRDDRPHAGPAPGAIRVRPVRRAPGLSHGGADQQSLQRVRRR
jgi:choline dehydrogenase-like flavoprotein